MRLLQTYASLWQRGASSPATLRVFRFIFAMLLAVDAWLQIEHAPRYGAGDFNVAHFAWLDVWVGPPSRVGMLAVYLGQCYLAFRLALGSLSRFGYTCLVALFGYGYFVSQLNSYQHHYLLFLVLVIGAFLPWHPTDNERRAGWASRLLFVQVALLYSFAAFSKMESAWLSGDVLMVQIASSPLAEIAAHFSPKTLALAAVGTECLLALVWFAPKTLWPLGLLVGVPFHLAVELGNFDIGLFSYFMAALYILMVPGRVTDWILRLGSSTWFRVRDLPLRTSMALALAMIAISYLVLSNLLPFAEHQWLAIALCAAALLTMVGVPPLRFASHQGLALIFFMALVHGSTVARDYHRFWGGSARRLGNLEEASAAYRRVTQLDPSYAPGHTSLGNLYRRRNKLVPASASYARALKLAPGDWRPHQGLAQVLATLGDHEKALVHAKRAVDIAPQKAHGARRIYDSLSNKTKEPR